MQLSLCATPRFHQKEGGFHPLPSRLRAAQQQAGEDLEWFPAPRPSLARVIALASVEGTRGHGLVSAARQRGAARCEECGSAAVRSGSCFTCENCGSTTGCA